VHASPGHGLLKRRNVSEVLMWDRMGTIETTTTCHRANVPSNAN
jgi:hypothetical protein